MVSRYSSTSSTPLDVCIQPARSLNPWYTKNCPHVTAPYVSSPSSLTTCTSARKKNDVCGLMSSSAWWFAAFDGAIAIPFDPLGSEGGALLSGVAGVMDFLP